jgi:hypothetical protein
MMSRNNLIAAFCALALVLFAASMSFPPRALGQGMTIPTRTPAGEKPTEPPDDGGGGEPEPTEEPPATEQPFPTAAPQVPTNAPPLQSSATAVAAPATATPQLAAATATQFAVVPAAATGTPQGATFIDEIVAFPANDQPFPEAGPCGLPPTFMSRDAISVYAGPSSSYPLAGLLGAGEVRPIVGRAAFVAWWVIQLDRSGRIGWVSDESGAVHGYIERTPIITAPELDGVAPTPGGIPWLPVPEAECTAPELAAGAAIVADTGEFSPPSGKPDSLDAIAPADASALVEIQGAAAAGELELIVTDRGAATDPLLAELAGSADPLALPASNDVQLPDLLPVAGAVLIVASLLLGLLARRRRADTVNES